MAPTSIIWVTWQSTSTRSSMVSIMSLLCLPVDGFHCSADEEQAIVAHLDAQVYTNSVDYVKRLFRDINVNLLRKFTRLFKKVEGGERNREWRELPEDRIRELWHGCRTLMETVITSEFKYIKIPKTPI